MFFPQIFEELLRSRGIQDEERDLFLNPDYGKLHSPLLLPDMEKARMRILQAIRDNEHIVIFSDYDADGIPGAVVFKDFFKRIKYDNHSFYIPHRHNEGFGLNMEAVEECASRGAKLLITVDCGVADLEEVEKANELGLDVIITDHHLEKEALPKAYAVVNPKRKDSQYPFPEICGSAVAYKLVQAISLLDTFGTKEGMEKWSLDMVGIATLSDCVPLIGENRILARFGLEVLRKSPRPGLSALFRRLKLERRYITEDDIAFMITPRINAASRMGVPLDAFKLLSTTEQMEAERLALHLEQINNERKGVVAAMVKEAKKHLEAREQMREVIVIGNPEWRPALLGLVANSLVETYSRPVFVWGRDGDGVLKGSCRTYNGYDLYVLMNKIPESFLEFGGHSGAGGFSITLENLTDLEEKLSHALQETESPRGDSVSKLEESSLIIELKDISEDLWKTISQFAPFGEGNEKPIFKIPQAEIKSVKKFGKENNHIELNLGNGIRAIDFFSTRDIPPTGTRVNLLANLEKSFFRNRPELRLRIVDIH